LQTASRLALAAGSEGDAARWESEAAWLAQTNGRASAPPPPLEGWVAGVATAGTAVWEGCGVHYRAGELWVEPAWPRAGAWWALLGLPLANGQHLSLLWDGVTLHATLPVHSSLPLALCKRIQIHHTDEFDFDPYFELTPDPHTVDTDSQQAAQRFKPKFVAGQ
jgi:hypothetical protein